MSGVGGRKVADGFDIQKPAKILFEEGNSLIKSAIVRESGVVT